MGCWVDIWVLSTGNVAVACLRTNVRSAVSNCRHTGRTVEFGEPSSNKRAREGFAALVKHFLRAINEGKMTVFTGAPFGQNRIEHNKYLLNTEDW